MSQMSQLEKVKYPNKRETLPLRTVSATWLPIRTAPANSNMAAMITACFSVRAFPPTEDANALARRKNVDN